MLHAAMGFNPAGRLAGNSGAGNPASADSRHFRPGPDHMHDIQMLPRIAYPDCVRIFRSGGKLQNSQVVPKSHQIKRIAKSVCRRKRLLQAAVITNTSAIDSDGQEGTPEGQSPPLSQPGAWSP
jgi:hypothetical protein